MGLRTKPFNPALAWILVCEQHTTLEDLRLMEPEIRQDYIGELVSDFLEVAVERQPNRYNFDMFDGLCKAVNEYLERKI